MRWCDCTRSDAPELPADNSDRIDGVGDDAHHCTFGVLEPGNYSLALICLASEDHGEPPDTLTFLDAQDAAVPLDNTTDPIWSRDDHRS